MAHSQSYGLPLFPWAVATSQATIRATITASPAVAVACRSICAKRSSRPSPRSPRMVSLRPASRTSRPNTASRPNEKAPAPGFPPSQLAPRMTSPSATENDGRNHLERAMARLRSLVIKHLLDRDTEEAGESQGERQRGGVTLVLDRVDGLAGHPHRLGQLPLGQVLLDTQRAHAVLHHLRAAHPGRGTAAGPAVAIHARPAGRHYPGEPGHRNDRRPAALPDRLDRRGGRDQRDRHSGYEIQPSFPRPHDGPPSVKHT